ncbi:hypothetical protein BSU01_14395 [Erwinia billingiae]|uniref:hypothetical protein n=1 Tax=Erwinia billingiae TaxID=182337 RepID=UPI0019D2BD85|nr:hypothetical protein [Erwinia billingiae]MBN7122890.1 hypothetical protein [Erwinia billingiae]
MLTAGQLVDVRRYMGYPMQGDIPATDTSDMAYGWVSSGAWQTLYHRLTTLSAEEEAVVVSYVTTLKTLESAITGAGDNLDTDQAAVWKRNTNEVRDRTRLFNQWRRELCGFIGIAPGPALGNGTTQIVRC